MLNQVVVKLANVFNSYHIMNCLVLRLKGGTQRNLQLQFLQYFYFFQIWNHGLIEIYLNLKLFISPRNLDYLKFRVIWLKHVTNLLPNLFLLLIIWQFFFEIRNKLNVFLSIASIYPIRSHNFLYFCLIFLDFL